MPLEVWIVKGHIPETDWDLSGYPEGTKHRDPHYEFSDGPAGERGSSSDYADLEQGLKDHTGYIIHWEG